MTDMLLEKMFEYDRWIDLIDKAEEKGINKGLLRQLCKPENRLQLYKAIVTENYEVSPPHVILIPKDVKGEFREVKANEDVDRIVLTLVNDCLFELFPEMIHKNCTSYQKGKGCQETVQNIVREMHKIDAMNNGSAYKGDLSKYFDKVSIEWIDWVFDTVENKLGFENGTEPVMNIVRKYYHSDWLFDVDGNLVEIYTSLKQGCSIAAFLADVILYDIDCKMTEMCDLYVRYSDDLLLIGKNADDAKSTLEEMLMNYGLQLNPKKVEKLSSDKWFKFLGFNIKGDMITLSSSRVKKFQKEIEKRSIKKKCNGNQARQNIIKYLYTGDYCWGSSCLGIINVKKDIDTMNAFILDCIRACDTGKKKIGGLGSVTNLEDRTILRGTGKNVKANRQKTDKIITNYLTMGCLANDYKISKSVFDSVVAGLQ